MRALYESGLQRRLPNKNIDASNTFTRRDRKPGPEPRRPVQRRCGFLEFPISPCPREFHLAQCGKVCVNWFGPPAALRIAVGGRVELRPKCNDSCYRSLRSISWILSPCWDSELD